MFFDLCLYSQHTHKHLIIHYGNRFTIFYLDLRSILTDHTFIFTTFAQSFRLTKIGTNSTEYFSKTYLCIGYLDLYTNFTTYICRFILTSDVWKTISKSHLFTLVPFLIFPILEVWTTTSIGEPSSDFSLDTLFCHPTTLSSPDLFFLSILLVTLTSITVYFKRLFFGSFKTFYRW